ncbi:MAG: hypothetical protein APF84_09115 [Gracilibacter sp. BRH_c7a]|nr:MAG: hypothetical protein APF84_09115 [Gracilibacter sp. BRH_c7a]
MSILFYGIVIHNNRHVKKNRILCISIIKHFFASSFKQQPKWGFRLEKMKAEVVFAVTLVLQKGRGVVNFQ